LTDGANGLQNA